MSDTVVVHLSGPAHYHYEVPLTKATPDQIAMVCPKRPDRYGVKIDGKLEAVKGFPADGEPFQPALQKGQEVILFVDGSDALALTKTLAAGPIGGGSSLPYALAFAGLAVGVPIGVGLISLACYGNNIGKAGLEKVATEVQDVGGAVKTVGKAVESVGNSVGAAVAAVAEKVDGMSLKHLSGLESVGEGVNAAGIWIAAGVALLAIARLAR